MRLSKSFFFTLRENARDEESQACNLLVRAGMIRKTSAGVYMMLPLGYKALNKIINIIREEMNSIDSEELMMPALLPEEIYVESGRRDKLGKSMFSLKDRFDKPYVLAPTHEELFAEAAKLAVKSYKNLPISLYQFQTKFRDEPRPRFGLIRVREFIMKDAYTFDLDYDGLDKSYNDMFEAYKRIFDRIGLKYIVVKADTGAMGGLLSEEFQAISDIGEDVLVIEENSSYAENIETAKCILEGEKSSENHLPKEKANTPNAKTIEEVSKFFGKDEKSFVKTLIYKVDDKFYAFCLRGDHELNETKVEKLLKANEVSMAEAEDVEKCTKAPVGFAGPINLDIPVIIDNEVSIMANFIVGANEKDQHYKNVNLEDFEYVQVADIRKIKEGDICENGMGRVKFQRGIEVGNTFKLGDKYSKAMDLYYTDSNNETKPVIMGSYGIGPARCLAALVEQRHSENSILWPKEIAPIEIAIVPVNAKDEEQLKIANDLYDKLKNKYDVLIDDRNERAGVKFADMELIGAYLRITCGRSIKENKLEFKINDSSESYTVNIENVEEEINKIFER